MKKGQTYTGIVERIEFPNKGIVTIDGEKAIIKNALPGQEIQFVINKKRNGRCEGRLLSVIRPSSLETALSPCPHAGTCGGCLMQTIPYEAQLTIKTEQIKTLLSPLSLTPAFEGIKPSPQSEGYRNKMEFSFGDEEKDGPLALGLHRRGSFHDIVNTDHCRIVHPDFTQILTATRAYFKSNSVPFYKKIKHEGYLRHLLVRRAAKTKEILVALVTTSQTEGISPETALLSGWADQLRSLPLEGTYAGILHIRNDSLADVVKSDATTVLYGREFFYEDLLGLRFEITPFSFFQTNSLGAEVLYETVREYIGDTKGKVIFDLYSGTGTIAQVLAPVAEKVTGVEIVEEAVEAARENAARNGLKNCTFIAGDVLKVVGDLKDKPDLIVLDPPRDGIHPKALEKIIGFGTDRMIYVSCKPTSLVRDLEVLRARGYEAERICCVDMFPSTANIETVCLLSRLNVEHHIEVEVNLDEMDLTKAESKATYQGLN
ncbi:MAG: 23S rRNA (uracil(1939)-C(5))-methyltransferase RlmD [Hungatella sp.]|nr:23S rRNA (uracil(1939)-C(5))-methyltransferase RlmD [Hungatella sp.]